MIPHYLVSGPEHAPPLVLSSSLGTTLAMWEEQRAHLEQRFRVIRYDRRGHGLSRVPPGPYTVADLGGDVLELLDELEIEHASFCGLSIGGAVGMWLALEAPQRIERLVLCCTLPCFAPPEQWAERAALVRSEGVAAVTEAALGRWFTPGFHDERPEIVERFRDMLLATPPEGYAGCCEALGAFDVRDRLGEISVPTLVLTGEHDPVAPPAAGAALAAAVPGARHVVIEGAAHIANVEHPEAFTMALLEHLGQAFRPDLPLRDTNKRVRPEGLTQGGT